ncbi:Fe-S cluster assembly scaffold protein NifU [candidate division CSSED10-310 bacterium]|uniref:Fe-S cluster assembly scaffold protein NifU n=1 Tax=candidate division CSSED10-310 bacterium TaxID=2855610 RepID=A0ABV6YXS6_UNCC1
MAIKYSKTVMDHFANPRNVGEIDNPDGIGEVGNPACGDIMTFQISVKDDRIHDLKFKTFGCGAAIAVSSMISEMAKGKSVVDALKITNKDVAQQLDGLPQNKLHCSNLGADALHAAIRSYQKKIEAGNVVPERVLIDHDHDHDGLKQGSTCRCPHCEIETPTDLPYCQDCGRELGTAPASS